MTSTSLTPSADHALPLERFARWMADRFARLAERLRRFDERLSGLRADEPETDEEVLAWASRLESTQPGFAADLRAAVLRKQGLTDF